MRPRSATVIMLLLLIPAGPARAQGDFDARVDQAIERGVEYLLGEIQAGGWFVKDRNYPMGRIAIQVYALIKSDVSCRHPLVEQGLRELEKARLLQTYSVSLYVMALDAAIAQLELERSLRAGGAGDTGRFLSRMAQATSWLIETRRQGQGRWDYPREQNRYDNSNTQFAVLALGVAARQGIPVPPSLWREIGNHFVRNQAKDGPEFKNPQDTVPLFEAEPEGGETRRGRTRVSSKSEEPPPVYPPDLPKIRIRGWSYQQTKNAGGGTFEMTCAGLSSLFLARRELARSGGIPDDELKKIDEAIRDGIAWIIKHKGSFKNEWYYYGLYGLEKVGDIAGIRRFGKDYEWYRQEAEKLLKAQKPNGSWTVGNDEKGLRYNTSFALLFLNRATDIVSVRRPFYMTGRTTAADLDPDWVYVPKIGGRVSARRLLRKLRFSPSRALLGMAEGIVENYEPEKIGDLVPLLLKVRESPYRPVESYAHRSLEEITGLEKDTESSEYERWYKIWQDVGEIGAKKTAGRTEDLRKILRESPSVYLKRRVLWTLVQVRARDAAPDVVEELSRAESRGTYPLALYQTLLFLTNANLPYSPSASSAVRDKQIEAWREWVRSNVASSPPAASVESEGK